MRYQPSTILPTHSSARFALDEAAKLARRFAHRAFAQLGDVVGKKPAAVFGGILDGKKERLREDALLGIERSEVGARVHAVYPARREHHPAPVLREAVIALRRGAVDLVQCARLVLLKVEHPEVGRAVPDAEHAVRPHREHEPASVW